MKKVISIKTKCPECGKMHNLTVGGMIWCPTNKSWYYIKNEEEE